MELDARVCRCGHTAHWHGAMVGKAKVPMGEGACDSCDCARMDEVRTDTLSSLRHDLKHACALLTRLLAERDENCAVAVELAERFHHEHNDYPTYCSAHDRVVSEDPETEAFLRAHGQLLAGAGQEG